MAHLSLFWHRSWKYFEHGAICWIKYSNFILRTSRCETPVIFYSQNSNKSVTSRLHQQKKWVMWKLGKEWALSCMKLDLLRLAEFTDPEASSCRIVSHSSHWQGRYVLFFLTEWEDSGCQPICDKKWDAEKVEQQLQQDRTRKVYLVWRKAKKSRDKWRHRYFVCLISKINCGNSYRI